MKNYKILELSERINFYSQSLKNLKGAKFAYTIVKNIAILQEEAKTMSSLIQQTDSYKEYEKERVALCEQFSKKEDDGSIAKKDLGNGRFEYVIDMQDPAWISAITSLNTKYKSDIEEYDKKITDYNKFLNDESTITLNTLGFDDIPSDISVELMAVIEPFIN